MLPVRGVPMQAVRPGNSQTRVAMVEDDADTCASLAASIQSRDWLELVATWRTGAEAMTALAIQAPDVLLVDLGLPDMSGLDIIRFAADHHPRCDILVISMFGDEANVLAALEAGASGYLLKGLLTRDVTADIRDLLAGGSPLSPVIARQVLKRLKGPPVLAAPDVTPPALPAGGATTLSPRETEILNAISRGFSYAEVADVLHITVATVHTHLKRIYGKLAVHSKTEAVFEAGRLGLLP
jgi:DNA-binding NarL/FixJ family response regulator